MSESNGTNGQHGIPENRDVTHLPSTSADKGREPKLVSGRLGTRMFSFAALVEKIVARFNEEFGTDAPALLDADTPAKRMKLVLATTDYTLAVESVQVSPDQKADLMSRVYSEMFGFGPLDALFRDESVTTIALDGIDKASLRYGHGELTPIPPVFEDYAHLRQIISRLLRDAHAEMTEAQPFIEFGLQVEGRPICVNLMSPPITIQLKADIRVHPKAVPTLDDLVESAFLTPQVATFLRALAASPHGFLIAGDTESGKTTLLSVLANLLPQAEGIVTIERAGELRLPEKAQQLVVKWAVRDQPGVTFGQQIRAALTKSPTCILLDEVRADEPDAIAPLLNQPNVPRQIWSFRGSADANRIRSALGMLARRADTSQSEAMARALYDRLPFIISVKRARGTIQLRGIAEWQFPADADYPDFVELMAMGWEGVELTGKRPARDLNLPPEFWGD